MSDMLLKWSDDFAFGLPDIDFEHQELFTNINKIVELKDEEIGAEILIQIHVEFLMKYVDHHFKEEEKMFDQTDYPKKEEHKKSHAALVQTVKDFKQKIDKGNLSALDEFIPVAKKWLTHHIQVIDKEYVDYCIEKGIGTSSKHQVA